MDHLNAHARAIDNFVRVANIIANLDVILLEAKNLSLTAKNARVVALRAGDSAFGFKPITNFIDEFSDQTIRITKSIAELSNRLFAMALAVVRCSEFRDHLLRAEAMTDKSVLGKLKFSANEQLLEKTRELESAVFELAGFFEDIQKHMRSAEYIAVTSRVEASNAGEFCDSLQSVSDFIAGAAQKIKIAVGDNLKEISQLRGAMR
ncbi:chemotaxis protein [Pseudoalteromonas xiamenensis]|uniref:Chemotaxis protein n=1 Tax=Pseudoalteromonas xiamenensis TaxID=882626 RepID=A0A975DLP5_9GAMM|nr:chemotaxis protein [Pseudoalteromonas xiamenensis]QTH73370.1 chemotaxis protein [Pseudoalteromonas xiamenensis]WMN61865.1 chemotaxis protein [Pseudoalteromonas xiamenensis]